jgi:hypothetical protein
MPKPKNAQVTNLGGSLATALNRLSAESRVFITEDGEPVYENMLTACGFTHVVSTAHETTNGRVIVGVFNDEQTARDFTCLEQFDGITLIHELKNVWLSIGRF